MAIHTKVEEEVSLAEMAVITELLGRHLFTNMVSTRTISASNINDEGTISNTLFPAWLVRLWRTGIVLTWMSQGAGEAHLFSPFRLTDNGERLALTYKGHVDVPAPWMQRARWQVQKRWRKLVTRVLLDDQFKLALETLVDLTKDRHPYVGFAADLQKLRDAHRARIRMGKKKGRRPPRVDP